MKVYTLRKKVVKAVQWFPGTDAPGAIEAPSGEVFLHTADGKLPLWPGCYVVVGIPGGKVVMSAEIFEATYVLVEKPKVEKPKAEKPKVAKNKVSKKKVAKKK